MPTRRRSPLLAILTLLAFTLPAGHTTSRAQSLPQLFEPGHPGARASERAVRPHQARKARVRLAALDAPALRLNLFDNADRVAYRTRLDQVGPNRQVWQGHTDDGGAVTLAVVDGVMTGAVYVEGRAFEVTPDADGDYTIVELNPAAFPAEDEPRDAPAHVAGDSAGSVTSMSADSAGDGTVQIDVMVVWTPAARDALGGTAAGIESLVLSAVANANLSYANSQIGARLNLVHAGEVAFSEGSIQSDLSALASNGDGVLDVVHSLRQQHGADIVTLLGSGYTASGSCGIGYIMQTASTSFAPYAFNIVDQSCAVGNLTYAHELGHNQGLQHDPGNAGATPSHPYAYGYQDPGNVFRTVLSYGGAPRVPHLSNPSVFFNGLPTGTSSQDNARALNANATVVASFKSSSGGGATSSCSYSVAPTSLSFSASSGTASVSVTTSEGCSWTSSSGASWVSVSGSGSGSGTAAVSVQSNGSSSRSGSVTVAGTTITVWQEAAAQTCSYSVSPTSLSFSASAASATVTVSTPAGCAWTSASDSSWASVSGAGSGSGTATVSVTSNGGSSRSASVTLAGQTVSVAQAATAAGTCSFTVSPTSLSFTSAGGSATVSVTASAGCAWTTSGGSQWLRVSGSGSGSGSATVTVTSTNGGGRDGSVTVAGQSVGVTQAGAPKGGGKKR